MTEVTDTSIKFWNRKAESYAKQPIKDQEAYERKLALTRNYLNPETRVLEFGCGTGSTALIHAPHVKHILAVDSSAKMIDIARGKARDEGVENVTFQHTTLLDLPEPEAPYQVILGLNVLHLLEDMDATIERCYQLLAPGGVFISSTACIGKANFLLKWLLPFGGKLGVIPKVGIFGEDRLEAAITRPGFQILQNTVLNKHGMTSFIIARK